MSDNDSNPRCEKCGLMKQAKLGGSMTSWISVCKCDSVESDSVKKPQAVLPSIRICRKCGKRINTGRSGSFTQWVFRADVCSCEVAEPGEYVKTDSLGNIIEPLFADENEQEIEVDGSILPLDRYKPLAVLGDGGWGTVYLCRDKLLGHKVAVKCLKTASDDDLVSFQKEAKLVSKLDHPNIVKVFDFGVSKSSAPYMVMEYYDGITLKEYIEQNGKLSLEDAVSLFLGLSDALSYTHSKDILHRDVTSFNVIVFRNKYDELIGKLVDFGIALEMDKQFKTTEFQGKKVVGTPAYMAPDQANGKRYDVRSEVYSLGCVLYEALIGKTPFQGESSIEVMRGHASKNVSDPAEFRPELRKQPKIVSLLNNALEKEPEKRIQTMKSFRAHLLSSKTERIDHTIQKTMNIVLAKKESLFVPAVLSLAAVIVGSVLVVGILGVLDSDTPVKVENRSVPVRSAISDKITKFDFRSAFLGDTEAFIASDRARFDWRGFMTLYLMPPDFEQFYIQYIFTSEIAEVKPVEVFFKERWNRDIDLKVSDVKFIKESEMHNLPCKQYKCKVDGVQMIFWTTDAIEVDRLLSNTCARIVGVPPGYGLPMKAVKSYKREHIKMVDKEHSPVLYSKLKDSKDKTTTVDWLEVRSVKKLDVSKNNNYVFRQAVEFLENRK